MYIEVYLDKDKLKMSISVMQAIFKTYLVIFMALLKHKHSYHTIYH